jgi:hypothetical protein
MENSIISYFKKRINFLKKKIIHFVNVETHPTLPYLEDTAIPHWLNRINIPNYVLPHILA